MVFALCQIQKCQEQIKGLYVTFIDLTKVFDTVSRALWKILEKLGCPPKFITMVIQLYENKFTQVRHNMTFHDPLQLKLVWNKDVS